MINPYLANPEFFLRLVHVDKLFETHPLLAKKSELIRQLHPQQIPTTQQALNELQKVLVSEAHVWKSLQLHKHHLTPLHVPAQLDQRHFSFILDTHKQAMMPFGKLVDAAIRKESSPQVCYEYGIFLRVLDASQKRQELDQLLARQNTLITRAQARVADKQVLQDVELSLQDQKVLLAGLPVFSIARHV